MLAVLIAVPGAAALAQDTSTPAAPTIQSDKADYAPGELVTLTGSGWQAGESVNIVVNDDVGQSWNRNVNVIADPSGNISDSFNLPNWFVATYSVTATGAQSGVATTSFTDQSIEVRAQAGTTNLAVTFPAGSVDRFNNLTCAGSTPNQTNALAFTTLTNGSYVASTVNANNNQSATIAAPSPVTISGTTYNFKNLTSTTGGVSIDSSTGCITRTTPPGGPNNPNWDMTANYVEAPMVTSINRVDPSPTNASSVSWTVKFSQSVTGVDAGDFALANTGLTNPGPINVTGSNDTYTVSASTGTGNGSLGLNLVDDDSIIAGAGNPLGGTGNGNGNFTGQTYTINKDTTAPTSTHTLSANANANGWHNSDVTVTLNATDNAGGSGVKEIRYSINGGASAVYDSANKPVISTEGTTTFSYFAVDNANNTENPANSFQIKLDKTAPTSVSGSPNRTPDSNGWYNDAVVFTFTGTDTLSGIDSCSTPTYSGPDGTGKTVSGSCTDKAGNPSASVASSAIDYDATAPTNVATTLNDGPDHNGWYNNPVDWKTTGTDATSGIDSCSSGTYSGPDGTGKTVSGKCTDKAGNDSATATSADFKYDATAPTLNPSVSPNPVLLNGTATASAGANDATSGVDSSNTGCDAVNTSTIGANQSVNCHATDNAGNTKSGTATYSVGAGFVGWLQPVDGDGTATGAVNMGKTGRTYPIKWQLKDANGNLISDTAAQALVSSMSGSAKNVACGSWSSLGTDSLEDYTTGNTVLRYDATSDQFIYNYKAPSSTGCQTFVISKADGLTAKQANFNFTK
jgi:hypothetical protein